MTRSEELRYLCCSSNVSTAVRCGRWDEAFLRAPHGTAEMVTAFWPGNVKAGSDITVALVAGYAFLKTSRNSRLIFPYE